MSATMNVNLFSRYFTLRGNRRCRRSVAGRTFPVTPPTLKTLSSSPSIRYARAPTGCEKEAAAALTAAAAAARVAGAAVAAAGAAAAAWRRGAGGARRGGRRRRRRQPQLSTAELAQRYPAARYSQVRDAMEKLDFEAIVELVEL